MKIATENIENKTAYVYGVAKFVYLESLRKEKNHSNIDELEYAEKTQDFGSENCLEKCLNALSNENRELILDYYSEEKQAKIELHKQISEKLNLSKTALRMKILRIKQKLKNCLEECAS